MFALFMVVCLISNVELPTAFLTSLLSSQSSLFVSRVLWIYRPAVCAPYHGRPSRATKAMTRPNRLRATQRCQRRRRGDRGSQAAQRCQRRRPAARRAAAEAERLIFFPPTAKR